MMAGCGRWTRRFGQGDLRSIARILRYSMGVHLSIDDVSIYTAFTLEAIPWAFACQSASPNAL